MVIGTVFLSDSRDGVYKIIATGVDGDSFVIATGADLSAHNAAAGWHWSGAAIRRRPLRHAERQFL